jgi:hypothetical protein
MGGNFAVGEVNGAYKDLDSVYLGKIPGSNLLVMHPVLKTEDGHILNHCLQLTERFFCALSFHAQEDYIAGSKINLSGRSDNGHP